jgi:predicted phosphoribosyltransferase
MGPTDESDIPPWPPFPNRQAGGDRLAAALSKYRDKHPLVLAIPRGGIPVAAAVARQLDAEMDVVITRKLEVPGEPGLAMGAVTADGALYIIEEIVAAHGVSPEQLADVIARESAKARAQEQRLRGQRPAREIANRTVIVVDDGLATGATMMATLHALHSRRPAWLVAAAPVGSREACHDLGTAADDVVCLYAPEPFSAVSLHYQDFQAPDEETLRGILNRIATAGSRLSVRPAPRMQG